MKYRKEKFESRDECLIWCADNKPMYDGNRNSDVDTNSEGWTFHHINKHWQSFRKAIPIKTETIKVVYWLDLDGVHDNVSETKPVKHDYNTIVKLTGSYERECEE